MEERIENISILNVICFILYGVGHIFDKPTFIHIGFGGALISLAITVWIFIKTIRFANKDEKRLFMRSINSLVFCLFYCVLYLFTLRGF